MRTRTRKITTGTYENKFGIAFEEVEGVYARASKAEKPALARLADAHRLAAHRSEAVRAGGAKRCCRWCKSSQQKYGFEFFSIGGGLGIVYEPALDSGSAEWWKSHAAREAF